MTFSSELLQGSELLRPFMIKCIFTENVSFIDFNNVKPLVVLHSETKPRNSGVADNAEKTYVDEQ